MNYCTRGFSAFPRGFWTSDYYAPLDQPTDTGNGLTDYYLYNPDSASITVDWQGLTTSGSFAVPAGSAVSFRTATGTNVPAGSGLYFRERNGNVFWGVGSNDAEDYAHEWGYSLLPSTMLFKEHFLGWAPDAYPPAAGETDMGAFLSVAQDNTTVFVDYDNNGTTDQTYTLNRLQTQFVVNPTTGDLSGAHFWGTGPFTLAYGQNGNTASTTAPALDLGYVAIPGTDFISLVLGVSKSVSPQVVPTASGSTATFTLTVSSQKYTVDGVNVTDYMPPNWQYVAGSTTIVRPDKTTLSGAPDADPTVTGVPATGQTLSWSTGQVGNAVAPSMLQNQEITITFTGQTTAAFTAGTLSQNRVTAVGTRTVGGVTQTFTAKNFAYVTYGNVGFSKQSSVGRDDAALPRRPDHLHDQGDQPLGLHDRHRGVALRPTARGDRPTSAGSGSVTCESALLERAGRVRRGRLQQQQRVGELGRQLDGDGSPTGAERRGPRAASCGSRLASCSSGPCSRPWATSSGAPPTTSTPARSTGPTTGRKNPPASTARPSERRISRSTSPAAACGSIGRPANTFAIRRRRRRGRSGTSVTISFTPYDSGFEADEQVVAEYFVDGGGPNFSALFDGGTAGWSGNAQTYTIASFPGASIGLRFRATGAWNGDNDHMEIDDVRRLYVHSAAGAAIQRTVNLTGASAPWLSFTSAAAGLDGGRHARVQARATAVPVSRPSRPSPAARPPRRLPTT